MDDFEKFTSFFFTTGLNLQCSVTHGVVSLIISNPVLFARKVRCEINRRGKYPSFQMPSCNHCMCISIRCDRQHIIAVPVCVFSYMHGSSSVWPWAVEIPWMRGRPCKATHSRQAFNNTHQWSNQRAVAPQLHMRALWILSELNESNLAIAQPTAVISGFIVTHLEWFHRETNIGRNPSLMWTPTPMWT